MCYSILWAYGCYRMTEASFLCWKDPMSFPRGFRLLPRQPIFMTCLHRKPKPTPFWRSIPFPCQVAVCISFVDTLWFILNPLTTASTLKTWLWCQKYACPELGSRNTLQNPFSLWLTRQCLFAFALGWSHPEPMHWQSKSICYRHQRVQETRRQAIRL